jgi:hypothetical protein
MMRINGPLYYERPTKGVGKVLTDIGSGEVDWATGTPGPPGATGPAGPTGATGPAGPAGEGGWPRTFANMGG